MTVTLGDVHVSRPLTNIAVAFMQDDNDFIADKVFPLVPVSKQNDKYFVYEKAGFRRDEAQLKAPGTPPSMGGYDLSTDSYSCDVYAYAHEIADQVVANADSPLQLERAGAMLVAEKIKIKREKDFVSSYMTSGIWGGDYTGVSGAPTGNEVRFWDDYANSDPIADIRAAKIEIKRKTGKFPNKLVLGLEVFEAIKDHPDIIDRIKYTGTNNNPARVNLQTIAQVFEVDEILVAAATENTEKEGQTAAYSFICGKTALLTYTPSAPGIMTAASGYTFAWSGFVGSSDGVRIKKYRDVETKEQLLIEGQSAHDHKLVSADLGAFFASVIS